MNVKCFASIVVALLPFASTALGQAGFRHDAYGDPLPPGAILRLGTTRLQTRGGFAWTPDGKSLITMKNGTVFFWDLDDGHCHQTLSVPLTVDPFFTYGSQLALSRDGKHLVCTDFYGTIAVWNLETSEMISQPAVDTKKHEENLALAIHPDGKSFITVRSSGEVQIRDMATTEIKRLLKAPEGQFSDIILSALSPDGRTFVIGSRRRRKPTIYWINLQTDSEPVIQEVGGDRLFAVDFLADGRLVTTATAKPYEEQLKSRDFQVRLQFWDAHERRLTTERSLSSPSSSGCRAAFSLDSQTMVEVHQDHISIVDMKTDEKLRTIDGLNVRSPAYAQVAINAQGTCVAINDRDNFVSLYDLTNGQPLLSTGQHHSGGVMAAAWSPDAKTIATGDFRGDVRLWNATSGKQLVQFRGPSWGVFAIRFLPDGEQIVLSGDEPTGDIRQATGPIQWFDAVSGKKLRDHVVAGRARLVTPSPDGILLAVAIESGPDRADPAPPSPPLVVLDAASGKEQVRIEGISRPEAIQWSPDGKSLFACDDVGLVQIDIASGQLVARFKLEHRYTGRPPAPDRLGGPSRAAFSPNGTILVTSGGEPEIYGWSPLTGEKRWTIKTEGPYFRGLAVSPDESALAVIASASDSKAKTLRLFDIPSQRELAHFDLGRENCDRLAFSPDGSRILVGFYNGTALVYDLSLALAKQ